MQSKESDVLLKWYSEQMAKTQEDIAELKEELKKMEETHRYLPLNSATLTAKTTY